MLHEDAFLKGGLKESGVNVEVVKAKIERGGELKDGGKLKGGGESVGEIDAFDLGKTLGDPSSLVLFESAVS